MQGGGATGEGPAGGDGADELLAAVYSAQRPEEHRALYARWAATYESGFVAETRYVYHEQVAAVFVAHAGAAAGGPVLDIGCGTGLAGAALRRHGVDVVDGLDLSPEMLAEAGAKRHGDRPVYRTLIEADLTQRLAIDEGTYAGALSAGTFTHGHVGPEALPEVVRIVRGGGVVTLGINAAHYASAGFAEAFALLEAQGRITAPQLVLVPIYDGADGSDPDRCAHVAVFATR